MPSVDERRRMRLWPGEAPFVTMALVCGLALGSLAFVSADYLRGPSVTETRYRAAVTVAEVERARADALDERTAAAQRVLDAGRELDQRLAAALAVGRVTPAQLAVLRAAIDRQAAEIAAFMAASDTPASTPSNTPASTPAPRPRPTTTAVLPASPAPSPAPTCDLGVVGLCLSRIVSQE